jgi:hypothetical protein
MLRGAWVVGDTPGERCPQPRKTALGLLRATRSFGVSNLVPPPRRRHGLRQLEAICYTFTDENRTISVGYASERRNPRVPSARVSHTHR